MEEATSNPVFVAMLCVARCLIPLVIMLGISYLLRRFGIVAKPSAPSREYLAGEDNNNSN